MPGESNDSFFLLCIQRHAALVSPTYLPSVLRHILRRHLQLCRCALTPGPGLRGSKRGCGATACTTCSTSMTPFRQHMPWLELQSCDPNLNGVTDHQLLNLGFPLAPSGRPTARRAKEDTIHLGAVCGRQVLRDTVATRRSQCVTFCSCSQQSDPVGHACTMHWQGCREGGVPGSRYRHGCRARVCNAPLTAPYPVAAPLQPRVRAGNKGGWTCASV